MLNLIFHTLYSIPESSLAVRFYKMTAFGFADFIYLLFLVVMSFHTVVMLI